MSLSRLIPQVSCFERTDGQIVVLDGAKQLPPAVASIERIDGEIVIIAGGTALESSIAVFDWPSALVYPAAPAALPLASAAAGWTGTAGSGITSPPTDPARTTAKPVLRLLVPPNQYFTGRLVVGFFAAANDSGSLMSLLGLDRVDVYFENNTPTPFSLRVHTFLDVNGVTRNVWGWWGEIEGRAGVYGHGHLYARAVPRNGAMQARVMGPYQFSPQAAQFTHEIEVAATPAEVPGSRYKTMSAALSYLRTQSAQNPRITITEAFTGDMGAAGAAYSANGYCRVRATVPVTFRKSSGVTYFRPQWDGLWFEGANITIDFNYANHIYHENPANREHVFEGVNLTNSAGPVHYIEGNPQSNFYIARDSYWMMECTASNIANPAVNTWLVRGCSFVDTWEDLVSNCYCAIGNVSNRHTSEAYRTEQTALTVQYTGAGATATLELSGGNNTSGRVLTAKVGGSSVGTLTLSTTSGSVTMPADVVSWLNGLSGWTATLGNNTRRAAMLGLVNGSGASFGATDAKTAPLTLVTMLDSHTDLWRFGAAVENVVVWGNAFRNCSAQGIYLSHNGSDVLIGNNAYHLDPDDLNFGDFISQLFGVNSHVMIVHNTFANQSLVLRTDSTYNPDGYSLIANNLANITWQAGVDANLVIANNHMFSGTAPGGSSGTTIGGTMASLLVDPANGDFRPQGALLTNQKPPVVALDRSGVTRGASDAVGGVAGNAAADVTAPTITSAASGTVAENTVLAFALTADESVTWAVTGGADQARFEISGSTLRWASNGTKDFETPDDTGTNNSYEVQVRATDGAGNFASQTITITVLDQDEVPAAFTFTDVTGATASTQYTSNTITVAGLGSGVSTPVTITGGTYSKNGGAYTSAAGTAVNGDTFAVRHTSSSSGSTAVNTVLTIGGVSDTYTTTTAAGGDTTAPTITSSATASVSENVTLGHALTADEAVTWSIVGGADQARFEISGSTLRWASNGTKNFESPDDADTNNSYVVQVRATDGASNFTNQTITITVTDQDETPDAFTFTDVTGATVSTQYTSNTITVAGLGSGVSVPVTITGGTYSKNGGAYTSAAGTAVNGDTFAVRHTSSGSGSTATNTVLTIGGTSDTYTTTTAAGGYSFTNSEAATYVAAMTVQPDDTRKALIDTLVGGLKTDGIWSKLDWLLLTASHDAQAARLNAVNTAKSASAVNSPTFTTDRGYAGDASSAYLDLGERIDFGGQFTQNSGAAGAWVNNGTADGSSPFGNLGTGAQNRVYVVIPASGNETFRVSDSTAETFRTSDGTVTGHRVVSREGSAIKRGYRNGSQVADLTTASVTAAAVNATILRRQSTYTGMRVAAYHSGAGLTATEVANLYSRLNTFLTAIGAN